MNVAQRIGAAASEARTCLCFLGRFRLSDIAGSELHVRTRKARAVLALLAFTRRPWSRETLGSLLWSDRGEDQVKASVRQAVFELRHLGDPARPLLVFNRDELAVDERWLTTDLRLIRSAAEQEDLPGLEDLLAASDQGLLADLDGLDPEFDNWLRAQRVEEPSRTLAAALSAAERFRQRSGDAAARETVAQVLRLDPTSEEAVRLAMRIDHAIGDSGALHRHFDRLRTCLSEEYHARPSPETERLFELLTSTPVGTSAVGPGGATDADRSSAVVVAVPPPPSRRRKWLVPAGAAALLALTPAALLTRSGPSGAAGEAPLLAVLPFEQQTPGDSFLADGLWEDTRAALALRSGLKVLGRSTTMSLAEGGAAPAEFERRLGVDYLLDGTVRSSGDRVRVVVSLTRTADGVTIWTETFTGQLGDSLALQEAVAQGIEGRLRGRLARGGGRRAEQIATSPEVYGLYAEARELIASREREKVRRAGALLRQAVARDPNYAPAWASLAAAIYLQGRVAIVDARTQQEAGAAVRRALTLAPNLAQAHATLAMLEGENAPAAERALRRAVALDPNYADAWNWLGNALNDQFRYREAMDAYRRALAIDPLQQSAVRNLAYTANELQDRATVERLLAEITRAGASRMLIGSIQADQLYSRGDYSGAVKVLQGLGVDAEGHPPVVLWFNWLSALTALGHYDVLHGVTDCPEWYAPLLQEKAMPPPTFDGRAVLPAEFWTSMFFSTPASRTMVNAGRSEELVKIYRAGFRDADEFISLTERQDVLVGVAPTLAFALSATGARKEARYILSAASSRVESALERSGSRWAKGELAVIRAAQGEHADALALLEAAVAQGWLPDGRDQPLDLARDPSFRQLRGNPRFAAVRTRILGHIARERAELGPLRT